MDLPEKIFIIQPIFNENYKVLQAEAISLIESAGALYCGSSYQNIREINPATFIGTGKLAEIADILDGLEGVSVLFNGSLSPSQTLNISAALGDRKVIDRTTLILDIFAKNAVTSEGKIQVELAQLKYIYPRLKGKGAALSRLGGGIGSRGPGETQLETDRRHIRNRIKYLEKRLEETETRRRIISARREKTNAKTIALVGYTNTGKSTLLNLLTKAEVLTKDALFATLDPTSRKLIIDGNEYLLTDTVGFIQELPHDIVEAFKSTLEAAVTADLALIVADADGDFNMQFETTFNTLASLGFKNKTLKVLNKCDKVADLEHLPKDCVMISAKYGKGIDELKEKIAENFKERILNYALFIPYSEFHSYEAIKDIITERNREYTDDGMTVEISVDAVNEAKIKKFLP